MSFSSIGKPQDKHRFQQAPAQLVLLLTHQVLSCFLLHQRPCSSQYHFRKESPGMTPICRPSLRLALHASMSRSVASTSRILKTKTAQM